MADNVNETIESYEKLAREADARVKTLADGLNDTLSDTRGVISEDAPLVVEMENMMMEISEAARSFRRLADYLEQHPEALLRGKPNSRGK